MVDLRWDGNDFRNEQDSSGSTADLISHSGKLQQGYQHGSLTKGLVAYYPMEKGEGEVVHDGALDNLAQIKPGSNGTTNAANIWTAGKVGNNALQFDGKDDHVEIPHSKTISPAEQVTLSTWFKITGSYSSDQDIIHKHRNPDGSRTDSGYMIHTRSGSGGVLRWFIGDGSNPSYIDGTSDVMDGNWHHVTGIYDGYEQRLYVDGQLENSEVQDINRATNENPLSIGYRTGNDKNYVDGKIDDIRIYNRVLSKPEIKALYNLTQPSGTQVTEKQVPGQEQGGVSRYKFNGDVKDSWGNNDGTNNGATFNTGVHGQAAEFNGSSDYVSIPPPTNFSSYTISFWAYPKSSTGGEQDIIALYNNNEVSIVLDHPDASEKWKIQQNYDKTWYSISSNNKVSENTWYHISGRWNWNRMELYVNGVLQGSVSVSGMDQQDLYSDIGTRSDQVSEFAFNGKIDDVRIYNTALTPRQIEKLYHKGAYRIPRESTLQ